MTEIQKNLDLEVIVAALYVHILGRKPDKNGLEAHVKLLQGGEFSNTFPALLSAFLKGDEATARFERQFARDQLGMTASAKFSEHPTIEEIVSFGTHCYTSELLKSFDLKRYSAPFDWLFSSSPMIAHCIGDNFETLLNPKYYEPVAVENRRDGPDVNLVDHAYYRDQFNVKFVFNHHDVQLENDYQYLVRCVQRVRACLASTRGKLFLMCSEERANTEQEFLELSEVIRQNTENGVLFVFAIADGSNEVLPSVHQINQHGQNILFRLQAVSKWKPLEFEEIIDDLAIIRTVKRLDIRLGAGEPTAT